MPERQVSEKAMSQQTYRPEQFEQVYGQPGAAMSEADAQLDRLLNTRMDEPWIKSFLRNIAETINPPKLPPLQLTSRPLQLAERNLGEPWFKSIFTNLRAALNPPTIQPGEFTSQPVYDTNLGKGADEPWLKSFFRNIREIINPPKLPPLEVTSKPVPVKDIWGFYGGNEKRAGLMSLATHGGIIALLLFVGTNKTIQQAVTKQITLMAPIDLEPYVPQAKPKAQVMGGGGGGGDNSPTPPSKGRLPRVAPRQFTPPMAVVNNPNPKLVMEPTIIVQPDAPLPNVNMPNFGDPLAKIGPPSNGPGSGGGIGTGSGGGVGPGRGQGYGPGEGGGVGGGVYRIGGGVSAPSLLFKVEPEYSEEARKAKFQGTVVLQVVVDEKGLPRDLKVLRQLGLGLDEKAIEAVSKWRFKPGYKDGRAVSVAAVIEVNFRLL